MTKSTLAQQIKLAKQTFESWSKERQDACQLQGCPELMSGHVQNITNDVIEERGEPFAYYIETELQDGTMEGSFIKTDSMKYKYIADGCDMIGGPIALYK